MVLTSCCEVSETSAFPDSACLKPKKALRTALASNIAPHIGHLHEKMKVNVFLHQACSRNRPTSQAALEPCRLEPCIVGDPIKD